MQQRDVSTETSEIIRCNCNGFAAASPRGRRFARPPADPLGAMPASRIARGRAAGSTCAPKSPLGGVRASSRALEDPSGYSAGWRRGRRPGATAGDRPGRSARSHNPQEALHASKSVESAPPEGSPAPEHFTGAAQATACGWLAAWQASHRHRWQPPWPSRRWQPPWPPGSQPGAPQGAGMTPQML